MTWLDYRQHSGPMSTLPKLNMRFFSLAAGGHVECGYDGIGRNISALMALLQGF
jgi:hypothetical protein